MSEEITVIVTSYNCENGLPQTLDSLIAQPYQEREAIVVDDGSKASFILSIADCARKDRRIQLKKHPGGVKQRLSASIQQAEHLISVRDLDLIRPLARRTTELISFYTVGSRQLGHGHINCKPIGYWLSCWREIRWRPTLFDTLAVRCAATTLQLRRNSFVLRPIRPEPRESDDARAILGELESLSYSWYSQNFGVRDFALNEAIPSSSIQNFLTDFLCPT